MDDKYVLEICKKSKVGSQLFVIEVGHSAYIFIGTTNPRKAKQFFDIDQANFFISQLPEIRRKFFRPISFLDAIEAHAAVNPTMLS